VKDQGRQLVLLLDEEEAFSDQSTASSAHSSPPSVRFASRLSLGSSVLPGAQSGLARHSSPTLSGALRAFAATLRGRTTR
jgi:hypothetical protein